MQQNQNGKSSSRREQGVVPYGEEKAIAAVCISKYESIEKSSLGISGKKKGLAGGTEDTLQIIYVKYRCC